MSQTNLRSDGFCSYNQEAAEFYWRFEPYQYANTYVYGEVGINAAGGTAGSYVRPDVVDVDSFLSGRDDILSRCNPPVPGLDEVDQAPLVMQNTDNVNLLLAKYTREKKSATDLSAVDYNRWQPNLPVDPQDLRFIIEDFSPQRGGMDTSNYAKAAWQPTLARGVAVASGYEGFGNSANYGNNASTTGNPLTCQTILDPSRACGDYCNTVSGYTTFNRNNVAWGQTGQTPVAKPMTGRPQPNYPFEGPTSQQMKAAGIASCGENLFWGPNYDQGSCGAQPPQTVLLDNYKNNNAMATMAYSSVA